MDPWIVQAYREAHKLRRKMKNEELYVNGIYTLKALSVALHNAFSKQKIEYYKEPLDIFPKTEAEIEMEKRNQRKKLIEHLNSWRI